MLLVVFVGCRLCKFCSVGSSSSKNLILKALSVECLGDVCRLFGVLYRLMYV